MKNVILAVIVVAALVGAGVGGTLAGFVDTEMSQGNFIQAGISDLLVNGRNDPVGAKIVFDHATPCKSIDFWVDLYNWGKCQGGWIWMEFKDVVSTEAGVKVHNGVNYVYTGNPAHGGVGDVPVGYRPAVGNEPVGAGVWSSEPEKIAEVGGGYVGQIFVAPDNPNLLGEDYGSGVAAHLGVTVTVPKIGTGDFLGNPDTNGDGFVDPTEYAAWTTAGNRWQVITSLTGKLADIELAKDLLGFLRTQERTFVHIDVHLQQISATNWPDEQTIWWPTNAIQGDIATWAMMWEMLVDPPEPTL